MVKTAKKVTKEFRTGRFPARFRPSVKEAAETAAEDQNRSFNQLLETVLTDYLKANGYLSADGKAIKRK